MDRYCKEVRAGRPGGEQGRGNNRGRAKRKMRMLSQFGDGQTAGCIYCGIRMNFKTIEVEKLDPVMGYDVEGDLNCAPAYRGCNSSLGNKTPQEKMGTKMKRKMTKPRC